MLRNFIAAVVLVSGVGFAGNAYGALLDASDVSTLAAHMGESISVTNVYTKQTGDTAADWHAAVDNIGRTFTLMEITGANAYMDASVSYGSGTYSGTKIIGGYNPLSWSMVGDYSNEVSRSAFIFNLTDSLFMNQKQDYDGQFQTYNHSDHGASFGGGHDIYTRPDLSTGQASPYSYGTSAAGFGTTSPNILSTIGVWDFTIGNFETYRIDTVSAVPLPPSAILFGTALLGLGVMRRRKRKAAA